MLPYVFYDEDGEWIGLPVEVPYWQDAQPEGQTVCGCSACVVKPIEQRSRVPMEPSMSVVQGDKTDYNWTEASIQSLDCLSNESKDIIIEFMRYANNTLPSFIKSIFPSESGGMYGLTSLSVSDGLGLLSETSSVLGAGIFAYGTMSSKLKEQSKGFKYFELEYDSDEQLEQVTKP